MSEPTLLDDSDAPRASLSTLKRLLPMAEETLRNLPLAFLLLVVLSLVQVLIPQVMALVIDGPLVEARLYSESAAKALAMARAQASLEEMGLLFLGLLLVGFAAHYLSALLLQRFGQTLVLNLRRSLFAKLHRLPISYFDKHAVGRTVSRVVNDSNALSELFTSVLAAGLGDCILLVLILAVLLLSDPILSLILFVCCPFLIALVLWFRSTSAPLYETQRKVLAKINAFFSETMNGLGTVKSFGGESFMRDRFETMNQEFLNNELSLITKVARFRPGFAVARMVATGLLLTAGGFSVLYGHSTIGTLISSLLYVRLLFSPLEQLAERYNILIRARVAAARVLTLLDQPEEPSKSGVPNHNSLIEFKDVSYFYDPDKPVLKDVSFQVAPGETVALVGPTGSGKSTIVSLLMGFYPLEPERGHQGAILIDGTPLPELNLENWRRGLAYVSQELFLFKGTVGDNVSLHTEISQEQLQSALARSGARRFLDALPEGAETAVGEEGQSLSTGQRQLLAFARALAHDPKLLILDEATANIDSETEAELEKVLDLLLEGRQAVVIAHRLSTVRRADRILVLRDGQVVEQGSHQELMQKAGLYAQMVRKAGLE